MLLGRVSCVQTPLNSDIPNSYASAGCQQKPPGLRAGTGRSESRKKRLPLHPGTELIDALALAHRSGTLAAKVRQFARYALLIIDEIGFLPLPKEGANLFFQLVSARYEKGAMILTSNRTFSEWGEVFGNPVIASALLDRLLHHAVVISIERASYRLREHRDLLLQDQKKRFDSNRQKKTRPTAQAQKGGFDS